MGESSTNILNLSESALNLLKKSDLVQKILVLKENLSSMLICINSVRKLKDLGTKESMNQIVEKNKKLQEGDNHKLMEGKIVYLEKKSGKRGSNIAAETCKYQAYHQTAFLIRILRTQ